MALSRHVLLNFFFKNVKKWSLYIPSIMDMKEHNLPNNVSFEYYYFNTIFALTFYKHIWVERVFFIAPLWVFVSNE